MKIYTCNCLFDASLFAMKYKDDFARFKSRCFSMIDCGIWFYDGKGNTC